MIGYVYVMHAGRGPKKLGITTNLVRRAAQLSAVHGPLTISWWLRQPDMLLLPVESTVFRMLQDRRVFGEWFNVTVEEARKTIRSAAAMVRTGHFIDVDPPHNARRISRWVLRSSMPPRAYSDATKAAVLESLRAGLTVKAVAHLHGVSEPVAYKWRKKHVQS